MKINRILFTNIPRLFPGVFFFRQSFANEVPVAVSSKDMSALTNWPVVLIVLIGMIGFIFALAWFVKRFGGLNFSGNREMKVVTSIALGNRERIALIDIKGKQFLIGVTAQQISHLHSFEQAVIPLDDTRSEIKQNDFVSKLQTLLNPVKSDDNSDGSSSKKSVANDGQSKENHAS